MKLKRFMGFGALALSAVTVVGMGFAEWTFSNQRRDDVNSNVFITHANTFGSFSGGKTIILNAESKEVENNEKVFLMLDQPAADGTSSGVSFKNNNIETATDIKKVTDIWTVSKASYNDTLVSGVSQIEYSVLVYLHTDTIGKYLEIDTSKQLSDDDKDKYISSGFHPVAGAHNHMNEGYTAYKWIFNQARVVESGDLSGSGVVVNKSLANEIAVQYTLKTDDIPFKWKDGQVPDTFQKYQSMVVALGAAESADAVKGGNVYSVSGETNDKGVVTKPYPIIIEFCAYNTNIKTGIDNVDNNG